MLQEHYTHQAAQSSLAGGDFRHGHGTEIQADRGVNAVELCRSGSTRTSSLCCCGVDSDTKRLGCSRSRAERTASVPGNPRLEAIASSAKHSAWQRTSSTASLAGAGIRQQRRGTRTLPVRLPPTLPPDEPKVWQKADSAQRRRLAVKGKILGRKRLQAMRWKIAVCSFVSPVVIRTIVECVGGHGGRVWWTGAATAKRGHAESRRQPVLSQSAHKTNRAYDFLGRFTKPSFWHFMLTEIFVR